MQDSVAISLPLWDDFSGSSLFPDTAFWITNTSVLVTPGVGNNAPTINVATLDGWDGFGNPYSQDPTASGKIDSLVSRPIDLTVPSSLSSSIYLSFFYQNEGNGDLPNESDSLVLQFLRPDGAWETVWPLPGETISTDDQFFTEKLIQVDPSFHWERFQLRFQAYGRQSGPFDTWNLDYIYLDDRRNGGQTSYLDRAFRTPPSSLFSPYTAIPHEAFFQFPQSYADSSELSFINLERQVQPVEYSAIVSDVYSNQPLDSLVFDSAFLALRFPVGQFILKAGPLETDRLDANSDSILLRTDWFMDSGDRFLIDSVYNNGLDTAFVQSIDLKINDTVTVFNCINHFFAYDDGTAEFGAGINQLNGRLAVEFVTPVPGFITDVDINFQSIGKNVAGIPLEIFVATELIDNTNIDPATAATVQIKSGLNEFFTYKLNKPIVVQDTFYVGYRQQTSDFLPVGLDKNTDNGQRIFYNVSGSWQKNTDIDGSLLLRPYFSVDVVTGLESSEKAYPKQVSIYPNPAADYVRIESSEPIPRVHVVDVLGKYWKTDFNTGTGVLVVDHLPEQMYILRMKLGDAWVSRRLLVTR